MAAGLPAGTFAQEPARPSPPAARPTAASPQKLAPLREALLWGFVLFLVFLVAAGVIVRFSVRFRGLIASRPRSRTPDGDVWKMHRLPEDAGPPREDPDEGGTGSAG